jgi:LysM repeat protein
VAAGDTLSGIATRTGVSLATVISANHLNPDSVIQIGQKLTIPGGAGASPAPSPMPAPAPAPAPPAAPPAPTSVTVAAGDSVSTIAARLGVASADLIAANHLTPDGLITIGQKLVVPGAQPAPANKPPTPVPAPQTTTTVTVADGDTLSGIAAKAGVSVQTLVSLNGLSSPDDLQVGQTLKIPASK